jgi:hypothetical protein
LEMLKIKEKLSMPKSEAQPRRLLGLSNWQMKKLQKLKCRRVEGKEYGM